MAKTRKLIVDIIGDASKFASETQKAEGYTKKLQGTMKNLGKSMAIGIGAGATAAFALGKSSLDAAIEAQKVQKGVEAAIKSTGGAANVSAKHISDFAQKMQYKTGIDDEVIKKSQGILLGFRGVRNEAGKGNKIFDRASVAMLDLGAKLGSTDGAAKALGRALSDPIGGLKGLKGAGVVLNEEQKNTIKKLVESGDLLGAQKIVLDQVTASTGGYAESQVTAGDKAKIAWGEVQEQIGAKLQPIIEKVSDWFVKKGIPAIEGFGKWAKKNKPIVIAFAAAVTALAVAIGITNAVMWLLSLNPIVLLIFAIIAAIVALVAIMVILYNKFDVVKDIVDTVGRVIKTVAEDIWIALKWAFAGAKAEIEILAKVFMWLWDVLKPIAESLIGLFGNIFEGIKNGLRLAWNGLVAIINPILKIMNKVPGMSWLPDELPRWPDDGPTATGGGGGIRHMLGEGGLVTRATDVTVGERGPEAIIPLDQLGFGQPAQPASVTINVTASPLASPADVGAAVVDALKAYERRNGSLKLKIA